MYGLLVEYISVPKQMPDYNKYKNPVGEQQFDSWRKQLEAGGTNIRFQTDYRRDARALKLISQTEWEGAHSIRIHSRLRLRSRGLEFAGDQPYADIKQWNEDAVKLNDPNLPEINDKHVSAQRCNNYIRCDDAPIWTPFPVRSFRARLAFAGACSPTSSAGALPLNSEFKLP